MKTIKILKGLTAFMAILFFSSIQAQTYALDYYPERPESVSEIEYNKGKGTLETTYHMMKKTSKTDISGLTLLTVASAYCGMGVEKEDILNMLKTFKSEKGSEYFCNVMRFTVIENDDPRKSHFYDTIGEPFVDLLNSCFEIEIKTTYSLEERIAKVNKMNLDGLNKNLIYKLEELQEKEQRNRSNTVQYLRDNIEEQNKLDKEVYLETVKILEEYGYPGTDMVGKKYNGYICHFLEVVAPLEAKEKYLPLVIEAHKNKQVDIGYVCMLIDRIYSFKYGNQIFGSQSGIPLAEKGIIEKVKKQYSL